MPSHGVSAADPTVKLRGLDLPAKQQDLITPARANKADDMMLRIHRLGNA